MLMCGRRRKGSGEGIRNWTERLPITHSLPEKAFATNTCRKIHSVQLCAERWAQEVTKERRKGVQQTFSCIFDFQRENTKSHLVPSVRYAPSTLHTPSLYGDSYLTEGYEWVIQGQVTHLEAQMNLNLKAVLLDLTFNCPACDWKIHDVDTTADLPPPSRSRSESWFLGLHAGNADRRWHCAQGKWIVSQTGVQALAGQWRGAATLSLHGLWSTLWVTSAIEPPQNSCGLTRHFS